MPNNKLTLSAQARQDIRHYIRHCDYEIGGFGYVTMKDNGDFYVDEVFLVEQDVTGTTVDFTDKGLLYAINKADKAGRLDELRFCWHSHVNMGAFWSTTDETMIANLNTGLVPYYVSLVQNKKHEHEARVDFYPPKGPLADFSPQVTYELDLYHELEPIPDHITEAYDALVTTNRPLTSTSTAWRNKALTQSRRDFLDEKVRASGYQSLSDKEQDDYDDMIYEDIYDQHNGQGLWDDEMWDAMGTYYESRHHAF